MLFKTPTNNAQIQPFGYFAFQLALNQALHQTILLGLI